jgi:hypothetical protein
MENITKNRANYTLNRLYFVDNRKRIGYLEGYFFKVSPRYSELISGSRLRPFQFLARLYAFVHNSTKMMEDIRMQYDAFFFLKTHFHIARYMFSVH